jgi:hypothetical protein
MLLLSPTFIMQGHSTEPPRTVLLRFFSFSDAQFFTDESPLIITADDVTAWPDTALFDGYPTPTGARVLHSATTDENSHVAETFGIEIPFETFVEIISAKRVIISLGPDRVELTAEQIEALRDMYRRIPQPPGATSSDRF